MDDSAIIQLFWERSECAITELSKKYGDYCLRLSANILPDRQYAQEVRQRRLPRPVGCHSPGAARFPLGLLEPGSAQPLLRPCRLPVRRQAG